MNAILVVAKKEFRDGVRNRWILAISLVFAVLALGLAYFGASASGVVGFTSLASTIVSLASLAIFLIPLISLLLAYDSIIGEEQQGTLLLLLTLPLSRTQLLLGKFLGHACIMATATLLGFGLAALILALLNEEITNTVLWQTFGFFIITSTLLGWIFIALAYIVSVVASEKQRAAGFALLLWFWFVIIFDLLMLGTLVLSSGSASGDWLPYLLLLNPTDIFRLVNLSGFEAARSYTGLAHVSDGPLFEPLFLTSALLVWLTLLLIIALRLFRRRPL